MDDIIRTSVTPKKDESSPELLGLNVDNVDDDGLSNAESTPRVKAKKAMAKRKDSSNLRQYSARGLREKHMAMPQLSPARKI